MAGAGERDEGKPPAGPEGAIASPLPMPSPFDPQIDASGESSRASGAWRSWLGALATDAEAALAAAMTYEALEGEGREAWLGALDRDRDLVTAPHVALYAPLLAVEVDAERRARIQAAIDADSRTREPARRASSRASDPSFDHAPGRPPVRAFRGLTRSGDAVCALATPLYLDFVELLVCSYHPDRGVRAALHEPFRHADQIASFVASSVEEPLELQVVALRDVIEELAHAVVADRRAGRIPPETLTRFSHLFGPDLEEDRPSA